MGIDDNNDDGLGGRSRFRREINESWRWGGRLVELPQWHLDAVPLPDNVRDAVEVGRTISSYAALKRQVAFIDGRLRALEDDEKDAIERVLNHPPKMPHADDVWRAWYNRLVSDGDVAIDGFLAEFPNAERQTLRQHVRNARTKPRGLERYLREQYGIPEED